MSVLMQIDDSKDAVFKLSNRDSTFRPPYHG